MDFDKMKAVIFVTYVLFIICSVSCGPCSEADSVNITDGVKHSNGSVIHNGVEYTSGTWHEVEQEGRVVILGCPCIGRTCIWKCCGNLRAFFDRNCTDTDLSVVNPFNPPVYKGTERLNVTSQGHFFFMEGYPCSGERYLVDTNANEDLFIQENGTVQEVSFGGTQWHEPKRYCVDMKVDVNTMASRLVAGVCYPETVETDDSPILYTMYAIGLMLSVPFLLATFLVYALIPDLQNLHGMCLMAYCGGLIIAYSFLAYLKLHVGQIGVSMTGCYVAAFIVYYAFQSSFFWLNVMCIDIWRTFSGYRGGSTNKRRDIKRFAMYGLYAWGVPIALTACTAGMQFSELPANIITPGFGTRRCWFVDWLSELVYFFTPVLVLVVCNVIFFTVTAHRIRSIQQETAILKGSESSRSDKLKKDKQRYGLYLKLFMVMGVNWTVELISFAVGGSNWYYIVIDIANIGLGLYIFLIFVWKKKVRNLVHKRFRNMFGMAQTQSDTRTSKWMTGSSSAPTEDTRVSTDETNLRLRDMH